MRGGSRSCSDSLGGGHGGGSRLYESEQRAVTGVCFIPAHMTAAGVTRGLAQPSPSPREVWHCGRPALVLGAWAAARGQGKDFSGSAGPELHAVPWSSAEVPTECGQGLPDGPGWPLGIALSGCSTPCHSPLQQRGACLGTHSKPTGSREGAGNKRAFAPAPLLHRGLRTQAALPRHPRAAWGSSGSQALVPLPP